MSNDALKDEDMNRSRNCNKYVEKYLTNVRRGVMFITVILFLNGITLGLLLRPFLFCPK